MSFHLQPEVAEHVFTPSDKHSCQIMFGHFIYHHVCVYSQCTQATESLQHAVVHILQSVGGQDQLIDPRSSFKRSLLDVSDAVIAQITASGGKTERRAVWRRGGRHTGERGDEGGGAAKRCGETTTTTTRGSS